MPRPLISHDDRDEPKRHEEQPSLPVINFIAPKESMLKRFAIGLLCAIMVTVAMNFGGVRFVIVHLSALVLKTGKEYEVKPAEPIKHEAEEIYKKVKEDFNVEPTIAIHPELPKHPVRDMAGKAIMGGASATADQLLKNMADARKEKDEAERKELLVRAKDVGLTCSDDWTLDYLRKQVEAAELAIAEAPEREKLYADADALKIDYERSWEIKKLREAVKNEEDYQAKHRAYEQALANYQDRMRSWPNGSCPFCRKPTHVSDAKLKQTLMCLGCNQTSSGRRMAANPPRRPAPPRPPERKKESLFKRIF